LLEAAREIARETLLLGPPPLDEVACFASHESERWSGQSRLHNHRCVHVAVAPTETGMGETANEVGSEQLGPERRLPIWGRDDRQKSTAAVLATSSGSACVMDDTRRSGVV
jgi:hypothetical protein